MSRQRNIPLPNVIDHNIPFPTAFLVGWSNYRLWKVTIAHVTGWLRKLKKILILVYLKNSKFSNPKPYLKLKLELLINESILISLWYLSFIGSSLCPSNSPEGLVSFWWILVSSRFQSTDPGLIWNIEKSTISKASIGSKSDLDRSLSYNFFRLPKKRTIETWAVFNIFLNHQCFF